MKYAPTLLQRFFVLPLAALALMTLAGCGSGSGLASVSGTVTLDGSPLPDALVSFYPEEGRFSSGTTDSSGHYVLDYTADEQGAVVGKHTVKITVATVQGEGGPARPPKEKVPAKYNEKSELTVEVEPGTNADMDFNLTSK